MIVVKKKASYRWACRNYYSGPKLEKLSNFLYTAKNRRKLEMSDLKAFVAGNQATGQHSHFLISIFFKHVARKPKSVLWSVINLWFTGGSGLNPDPEQL